jgi:membrane-associated phospholipid phosphatase
MRRAFFSAFNFRYSLTVLLCASAPFLSIAQSTIDSLTRTEKSDGNWRKLSKFAGPVGILGLGALAIKNPALKDLNRTVRYHVLASNPNTDNHIEDNLRHLPSASAFLLQAAGIKGKNNFIGKAAVYALATTIADQTAARLKTVSRHQRPDGSDFRSFPSGHTTTAFVAAEFLRKEYGHISPWITLAGYTSASAVGALRVYHNKHWLTDVMAGASVGILSTNLAYFLHDKAKTLRNGKGAQRLTMLPAFRHGEVGLGLRYQFD